MDNTDLQKAKAQLARQMAELTEKKKNPFKGSPLEPFIEEITAMRKTHGLPFIEIANILNNLPLEPKLKTTGIQISNLCSTVLKLRTGKRPKKKAPAAA
jgi:hypothetical protein